MDICPDIIFPYFDIILKSLFLSMHSLRDIDNTNPTEHKVTLIYDLFYNGMWQKPKENTYWIHENVLLANATRYKHAYLSAIIFIFENI